MLNQNDLWAWFTEQANALDLHCLGVADTQLQACAPHLQQWLDDGMHGEMHYMAKHGLDRLNPDILLPGTIRIVSFRFNYIAQSKLKQGNGKEFCQSTLETIQAADKPYVSLYAHGRDYHKVIRNRLSTLAKRVHQRYGEYGFRVACDSAPTPEVEIARKAGLGWRGKHTLLIHPQEGSMFFLGEVFTNLPLPVSKAFTDNHCGQCFDCAKACPTGAIVAPYKVDARRCVSYLTIEHESAIPLELRDSIGTRLYGCDDCQLACPWNKFAKPSEFADFNARNGFDQPNWQELFNWTEEDFLKKTEGMAMRRIGYRKFRRNLAVAAGNSKDKTAVEAGLKKMRQTADAFLAEHIDWALNKLAVEV